MKGRPIDQLVYECMFPKPKPGDPQSFHDLLRRQLVPEVRSETVCFYGSLDTPEARYPGLDYSYPPHRMRLSRFTWHRRLFRAFDTLKLTPSEIAGLTKWEGTRWAKERHEQEEGIKIRDTTGDCIHDWVDPELRRSHRNTQQPQRVQEEKMEVGDVEGDLEDMNDDGDESDMEIDSVGVELNERLRAAAALREAGNATTVMDEEWEQWLKDAAEAGGIPSLADHIFPLPESNVPGQSPSTSMPPRLLNAARLGQWHQIPEFLQVMVRQNIEAHNSRSEYTPSTEQASQRRENLAPVTGRTTLRSISTTAPLNIQQRQPASVSPGLLRTSLSRGYPSQAPASSLLSLTSWQQRFQQEHGS
jgi:hypothetical protein